MDLTPPLLPVPAPPPGLRLLTSADVPRAMELKEIAGWNQTARDWEGYLGFEPEGCFAATVGGVVAGTATTIAYGRAVGWIGMVLVHPDFRRRGIGSLLLRRSIDYLREAGVAGIKLDATPVGRPVYVPLGFRDEYELCRYEGEVPVWKSAGAMPVEPLVRGAEGEMAALDTAAFGAGRPEVLASLAGRDPGLGWLARDAAGRPGGYLIAREGAQAVQIGPWVARSAEMAETLLGALFSRFPGRRVFVDVPCPNGAGLALMQRCGFVVQRSFTRMYLGENLVPGRPHQVYGTSGAEKG